MSDRSRRQLITLSTLGFLVPQIGWATSKSPRPLAEGPRVASDPVVISSGLSARWKSAMARDLGWSADFSPQESGAVLDLLNQGQTDVGVFLSHPKADDLDKQGLIYERHTLASTDVVLVGPSADLAGIRSETDAGRALTQIIVAAGAGQARWTAPPANSALAALADSLTKGLASKGMNGGGAPSKAVTGPAYQLITRASMTKGGLPAGTKIWALPDPRMSLQLQAALSFRSRHAAGKLLVTWLQWPMAQSIVNKSQPAWRKLKA